MDVARLSHIHGNAYKDWLEALKADKPVNVPEGTIACGYYRDPSDEASVTFHPNQMGGFFARKTPVDGEAITISSPSVALDLFNKVKYTPVSYEETMIFLNTRIWPEEA